MKESVRISFEFYPPKSKEGVTNLIRAAQELAKFSPEFFSVTFGAGGSTREGTIETVGNVRQKTGISVAPHLSCIGYAKAELVGLINEYKAMGVNRIVAIRGDLPSGMVSSGDVKLAYDLIKLIRKTSGDHFHIEAAAYPEYHPQAKSALYDVFNKILL